MAVIIVQWQKFNNNSGEFGAKSLEEDTQIHLNYRY